MIAAMAEVFYVRGTREWPLAARIASVAGCAAAIAGGVRLVTFGNLAALGAGVALGAAGAGGLAWFLRSMRRDRWVALDDKELRTSDGDALAYGSIAKCEMEGERLRLNELRIPTTLVRFPLFVATLEDRMGKSRGTIARIVR